MVSVDDTCHLPVWRNWQTQQTQNLPWATMCRFESGHRHHLILLASRWFRGAFFVHRFQTMYATGIKYDSAFPNNLIPLSRKAPRRKVHPPSFWELCLLAKRILRNHRLPTLCRWKYFNGRTSKKLNTRIVRMSSAPMPFAISSRSGTKPALSKYQRWTASVSPPAMTSVS